MSQDAEGSDSRERLTQLANQLVLKGADLNILRNHPRGEYPILAQSLEHLLRERDAKRQLFLPNLTAFGNDAIGIFSDFAGESSGNYYTYSVLVCGYRFTGVFGEGVKRVRDKFHLGDKEIAFKDFGMGQVRASLPEYLAVADTLPGFLCTLAVDKRITTLFGPQGRSTLKKLVEVLDENGLGGRKPAQVEKLLRVTHMTAFLVSLLAADGQKIFWMTDNDEICANAEHHRTMMKLLARILAIYTRPGIDFPLLGGALPFDPPSITMNDLLSLPDVVAGTIAHYLSKSDTHKKEDIMVKEGADKVLCFLAGDGIGLKKGTFVIRLNTDGMIERGTVEFSLVNPPTNVTIIPIFE